MLDFVCSTKAPWWDMLCNSIKVWINFYPNSFNGGVLMRFLNALPNECMWRCMFALYFNASETLSVFGVCGVPFFCTNYWCLYNIPSLTCKYPRVVEWALTQISTHRNPQYRYQPKTTPWPEPSSLSFVWKCNGVSSCGHCRMDKRLKGLILLCSRRICV